MLLCGLFTEVSFHVGIDTDGDGLADNHDEAVNFFANNYEEYIEIAKRNLSETGVFYLDFKQIKLGNNPEEERVMAGQLGFDSVDLARRVIRKLFDECSGRFQYKGQRIATKAELVAFFREKEVIPSASPS